MNKPSKESPELSQLRAASAEVERSKRRFASTMGALQYRLKPGTLMSNAWEGVRDKSGEVADTTLEKVKERPGAVSGILAAIVIFIAREPLWRFITGLFARRGEEDDGITIRANLDHDESYDLTAPTVERSRPEGVNA